MASLSEEYEIVEELVSMNLTSLLRGVTVTKMFQTMFGQMATTHELEVSRIQYDSRKVKPGDLFVAIYGTEYDGNKFIQDAVHNGAKVVIMEDDSAVPDSFLMHHGVVKVIVPNSRIALAQISSNFFGKPANKLLIVGVTGTNGKTTTAYLIKSILDLDGQEASLIGTVEYKIRNEIIPATFTTPESLELNELLQRVVEKKSKSVVMEVSSHALHQHRVHGVDYRAAVFTNLTQDHLDYHSTMDEYFKAKKMLFDSLGTSSWAIVNIDDQWGKRIYEASGGNRISYGINTLSDVQAKNVTVSFEGVRFTIVHGCEETNIESPLVGRFNIYNILAAFGTGIALGISKSRIQQAIQNLQFVRGRFESIISPLGWTVIIDYAHTPDALQKALMSIRELFRTTKGGQIITVFGCGGNRDRTKRPTMGRIATELSDVTVITSDNPRFEKPEAIVDEIVNGVVKNATLYKELDRRTAITKALAMARPADVILIAGKGHEEYQIVGDQKVRFSDREIVEEYLNLHA